ncbi:MAG: thioredoxin-dependent thiol peroxidase [Bacteroidetes bacterium]|jgi:peroxiredoxin Q/BCP|nr:thioredoxin-dependent thiol peroxidase [Bacteroidota bacterium]
MAYLEKGAKAPLFSGKNQKGETVSLEALKGKKVVVYFYPEDDTPGCTAEACNLRDNYKDLTSRGIEVIGISPDDDSSHASFADKYNLPFHLLPDSDKKIMTQYGAWGEKNMYGKIVTGVKRTTYIIDEEGKVEQVIKRVDTKNHSAQILKKLGLN